MRISKKTFINFIIPILICWFLWIVGSFAALFIYEIFPNNNAFCCWMARKASYQVLSLPSIDHHDAFIVLSKIGDESSVPHLISALRREAPTKAGGMMVCTKVHCLEALANIVNQDAGNNYVIFTHRIYPVYL